MSLVEKLKSRIGSILKSRPISIAYLYGSYAAGNATPLSDVDVALVAEIKLESMEQLNLELSIEAEINQACGISNCEVRIINEAPLVFQGEVLRNCILLYCEDEERRIDFEIRIRSLYFDFLPSLRAIQRARLRRLREVGLYG